MKSWEGTKIRNKYYENLRRALDEQFNDTEKSISELAENNTSVSSSEIAFDYDMIKEKLCGKDKVVSSCDALVVNDNSLLFIEFKTGCYDKNSSNYEKVFLENLQLRIRLKALESLTLFEKVLIPFLKNRGELNFDSEVAKKVFVAVIDSKKAPREGYFDVVKKYAGKDDQSFKKELEKKLTNGLAVYRKEYDEKHIFYNEAKVIYDFKFNESIKINSFHCNDNLE